MKRGDMVTVKPTAEYYACSTTLVVTVKLPHVVLQLSSGHYIAVPARSVRPATEAEAQVYWEQRWASE